jgi:hypothetical protein
MIFSRLCLLLLLWVADLHAISTAPFGLHVNREPNEALAVDPRGIVLGWAVPPGEKQASFNIRLQARGLQLDEYKCAAQASINCSLSDSVPLATLAGSSLPEGGSFAFQVQLVDHKGAEGAWSEAFHFATALPEGQMGSVAVPVWSRNATQNFVLFRRTFKASTAGEHLLHITAKSVPNRMSGGGANASKLLCAYKLWLNGVSIAVGPGRPTGNGSTIQHPALLYDTVNITSLLRRDGASNALAVEAFYWTNMQEKQYIKSTMAIDGDHDDMGGIMLLVRATQAGPTAQAVVATGDDGDWLSFDRGDEALSPYDPRQGSDFCQRMCHHAKKGNTCHFCLASGGRFQVSVLSSLAEPWA